MTEQIKSPNTDFCLSGPGSNPKQIQFLEAVYSGQYKFLAYGGAVRGGKSYVVLYALHTLCVTYPGSKWIITRASLPVLKKTTIPSFKKLIKTHVYGKWNNSAPITFTYHNGSQLLFIPESASADPDLNAFLGLECNGFFLEQSERMWHMALQRAGSLYLPHMPPSLVLTTFNPTQNWVKNMFYIPHTNGDLKRPYYYQSALPADNPHVTLDQWDNWNNMNERDRERFINGDWTDYGADGLWAFAFERKKHIGQPVLNPAHMVYLSFDFNRNPISCSVIQHYDAQIRVLETIKLANSDIYSLCRYIKVHYQLKYPHITFIITGDASGQASSAMVQDNLNYYKIIIRQLQVGDNQVRVPVKNPSLAENQVLVNSLLSKYDIIIHEQNARALIYDLQNVKMLSDGTIKKANRHDPTQQADALDTFRYFCNTFLKGFI